MGHKGGSAERHAGGAFQPSSQPHTNSPQRANNGLSAIDGVPVWPASRASYEQYLVSAAPGASGSGTLQAVDAGAPGSVRGAVYLRSRRFKPPPASGEGGVLAAKVLEKISLILAELGVPEQPVATGAVLDAYDRLRQDILKVGEGVLRRGAAWFCCAGALTRRCARPLPADAVAEEAPEQAAAAAATDDGVPEPSRVGGRRAAPHRRVPARPQSPLRGGAGGWRCGRSGGAWTHTHALPPPHRSLAQP